ncbi:nicotinate (nicotinamide) nucleotide adenylyltransferase [Candidatus Epulonipiscium fishelsonii]|uniref:Nicotinate (Nicotinamide) nucleotide adenylyltransferase n=1 Tax=Candidatus Epulonipiscium fishelsonii TaxID=77094 RepID=A0ACC8XJB4_9FIRM|nr:nicotinate (nicotinamide) nucleotide adenylyltransferase [Epulopiscium sp. SCG-D08WGA-EpuloA1]OON98137.1 MAG: nicotinate (nicotinamide) nucleotide adenylyltransferase [Epulopiscium sp. AS2M-Bin002]
MNIAILGGTFDPIHTGHLAIAQEVIDKMNIDKILFIPSGNPPHKNEVTSKEDRFNMTKIAIMDNPKFEISDIEINKQNFSYTIDTINDLHHKYIEDNLFFIIGADNLKFISNWKDSKNLLKKCSFIVLSRPDVSNEDALKYLKDFKKQGAQMKYLESVLLDISSSNIRDRVVMDQSIKYIVPENVIQYINKHGLYKQYPTLDKDLINSMYYFVKSKIPKKRFIHTQGVVQMALELAKIHGENLDKVYIGALFHDISKKMHFEEYKGKIDWDSFEIEQDHLKHGKLGAYILQQHFNVNNEDILNSIRFHTVGRPNMSRLEKIIYLADMVEYGREDGIEELRELCRKDLDKAMYLALIISKDYVIGKGQKIHPIVDKLINEYKSYIHF